MSEQSTNTTDSGLRTTGIDQVKCPKCGSTQISANKKGFQLTRAAGATYLFGPLGIVAGFLGSNAVIVTCLKCGNQWEPGK